MQINGIGNDHSSSSHNVTNCLHEHSVGKKDGAAARSGSLDTVTLSNQNTVGQQEGQLSLSAWLDKTLNSGKDLLQRIWGSDPTAVTNDDRGQSLESQVLVAMDDNGMASGVGADLNGRAGYGTPSNPSNDTTLHAPQVAAASAVVRVEESHAVQRNPYFTTVSDDGGAHKNLWQKMKVKMKDVAGRLSGRLPGRFAGFWAKGAFQTKQEQPREDLRKKSKYRQDKLEIDCVLTDDSYLQDSYNKKGEYSKLAGDMRGNMSTRK